MRSLSFRHQLVAYTGLLLAAVLVGIAAHPAGAASPMADATPMLAVLESLAWLGVAADVLVIAALIYALWPRRPSRKVPSLAAAPGRHLHWTIKLGALIAALAPLAWGVAVLIHNRTKQLPTLLPGVSGVPKPVQGSAAGGPTGEPAELVWITLAIAAAVLVALALWMWIRLAGRSLQQPAQAALVADLADVIEEGIDALQSLPDPRRAVIAAYASMERAFGRIGLPRRPFEAPLEFVNRILSSLPRAADDTWELTYLFELARFSQHEVDEEMRSTAVAALSRIRDRLTTEEAV